MQLSGLKCGASSLILAAVTILTVFSGCQSAARTSVFQRSDSLYGEVIYEYSGDSAAIFGELDIMQRNDPERYENFGPFTAKQFYVARSLAFRLAFDNDESLYELMDQLRLDQENEYVYNIAIIETRGDRRHYLNTAKRLRLYERPSLESDSLYHVMDDFEKHPWSLVEGQKEIAGYLCHKAVYEYKFQDLDDIEKLVEVIAWYAPELPYPYGPAGFDGLPGLILEVTTKWKRSQTFRAKAIQLDEAADKSIPALRTPDRITTEEVLKKEASERIEPKH